MSIIKSPKQLELEIIKRMPTNRKRGLDLAWSNANEFISLKKGYPIMIAGEAGVGKTELLIDIILNAIIQHQFKVAWLSPEMGTPIEIQEQLIEKLANGKVLESGKENSLSVKEVIQINDYLNQYIRIIDPTEGWRETTKGLTMNVENLFRQIQNEEQVIGAKFDAIVIDPFNELEWDTSNIMNSVKSELDALIWWTKKHNYISFLTNHVNHGAQLTYKAKNGNNYFYSPPATKERWAYGEQWARKGYQMILVYKQLNAMIDDLASDGDGFALHSQSNFYNMRDIYVQKTKPKGVGAVGKFQLFYDRKVQRYYNIDSLGIKQGIKYPTL
jgi:hypothetical protein